ncbi:hypothetical protein B0H17DRAFT_1149291 [Mycena rosella]|uniref:Uncharacterized protein n=1 Tax=Mycena rosella TaxID=1033263 RepID=A0AAD7C342_MYCRO|nr:hypothetical protein B0H17DRAFT_1149291 [Mycena rosella]
MLWATMQVHQNEVPAPWGAPGRFAVRLGAINGNDKRRVTEKKEARLALRRLRQDETPVEVQGSAFASAAGMSETNGSSGMAVVRIVPCAVLGLNFGSAMRWRKGAPGTSKTKGRGRRKEEEDVPFACDWDLGRGGRRGGNAHVDLNQVALGNWDEDLPAKRPPLLMPHSGAVQSRGRSAGPQSIILKII